MQNPVPPPPPPPAAAALLTEEDPPVLGAFFIQSDWTGLVGRESWENKHHPWRRIVCYMMLSSWALSWSTLVWLYLDVFPVNNNDSSSFGAIPIMQLALTPTDLGRIKASHAECFRSLCDDIGRTVDVACVVNDNGVSAHLELGKEQSELIFFTEECHRATEETFGYRYLDGDPDIGARPIALLHLQPNDEPLPNKHHKNETAAKNKNAANKNSERSILTLLPDCSITVNTASPELMNPEDMEQIRRTLNIDLAEWENTINGHFDNTNKKAGDIDFSVAANLLGPLPHHAKPPGYREAQVLKHLFCPEEMSQEVQELILPTAGTMYHWMIDCRHILLAVGVSLFSYCRSLGSLLWIMLRVLWPAYVMKRFLSWPEDKSIDYWNIWRNLVLLCLVSSSQANNSLVLTAIMTAGACYYRNTQAAMEWALLGVLAWGAPDTVYPVLDSLLMMGGGGGLKQRWKQIDFLGIVPWFIHVLVVGEGWWKLVTMYVVGRSYLSLRQAWQPSENDVELEQMQLGTNPGQQQQQQQQQVPYSHDQAHAKVD